MDLHNSKLLSSSNSKFSPRTPELLLDPSRTSSSTQHHIPRKPPANYLKPGSAMHVSDSAIHSSHLPSQMQQKITVLDGGDQQQFGGGTLHPRIDIRMASRYDDSANRSRESIPRPNTARTTSQRATPRTTMTASNMMLGFNNNSMMSVNGSKAQTSSRRV